MAGEDQLQFKGASTASQPRKFSYAALRDPTRWIRLLKVEGHASTDAIHCSLHVCEVVRPPKYGAISYAWGQPPSSEESKKTLLIDGRILKVWPSCHYALNQVLSNLQKLHDMGLDYFWIDSVCIDQANVAEKSAQVQIMCSDIFPNATKLFVSLVAPDQVDIKLLSKEQQSNILVTQEYWNRVWILPELMTATDRLVSCGDEIYHMPSLWSAVDSLPDAFGPVQSPSNEAKSKAKRVLTTTQHSFIHISVADLKKIIEDHADSRCTDVRDRVFAFWAIVRWPRDRTYPRVDYSCSICGLARDIMRLSLYEEGAGSLESLCPSFCRLLSSFSIGIVELKRDLRSFSAGLQYARSDSHLMAKNIRDPFDVHDTGVLVDFSYYPLAEITTDGEDRWAVDVLALRYGLSSDIQDEILSIDQPHIENGCKPFFLGSKILGSLCDAADLGDLLLEIPMSDRRYYLVLRTINTNGPGRFEIIGQAVMNPNFRLAAKPALPYLDGFSYACIDMLDLVSFVAPLYPLNDPGSPERNQMEKDLRRREHDLRPATLWPKCMRPVIIQRSSTERTGRGNDKTISQRSRRR